MNHIYHSIWNAALGAWVAVSEIATGQGKRSSNRRRKLMTASPSKDWQSCSPLLATGLLLCSSNGWALPTGEQLVAGQATINT
ncbi:MAG: ESPR domain-containing protein, partial [Methylococcales bacterium]